ncbi:hypothetical protein PF438_04205 [Elizabethkingia meningoseptica]|uniref:hypothetical protein n=1 Tax=Elizabethkingia meningoseptica TaxID=238 RepID=UPI0022F16A7C|nr:hypothetical protein [Elizabethkingia meningoseptica]EJK5330522.1 hypothetical protein [Elizabethkingia meningoseptica]WBS75695.1 hypothetical protein PF438_04205 [Elizabethkingia meningoseptica]
MNITDKVKSFEDACQLLGIEPNVPEVSMLPENHQKAIVAHYKLVIIAEAVNEGWKPNWDNWNERKYYPWFDLEGSSSGAGFSYYVFVSWSSYSFVGSRLCFKTWELAEYIGKTFIDLYKDYFLLD